MTTYTWRITQMYTIQQPDPYYVVSVFWMLTGDQLGTTSSLTGSIRFDAAQQTDFIPYDQLTEEIVIGWVQKTLGPQQIESLEFSIQGRIDQLLNPPAQPQVTPLPW